MVNDVGTCKDVVNESMIESVLKHFNSRQKRRIEKYFMSLRE